MDYMLVWSFAPLIIVASCYWGRRMEQASAGLREY